MKVTTTAIDELLSPLRPYFQKDNFTRKDVTENPPLRSELFSAEQMEQHAQYLATVHTINHEQTTEQLLKRLSDNEEILSRVNDLLQKTVKEKKTISPAGEWLLDNFYLIDEQIRIGKRHLPKGYSKGLPKLSTGPLAGYPRVYDIAIEIISHSDGRVDITSLSNFINAYQKVNYLTLGELWAVPIMIRLALLENLSRVAAGIAIDRIDSALANQWAGRIIETAEKNPKDLVLTLADMARSNPPMVSAFVAEFARKLQWRGPELSLPLNWVEQHLSDTEFTINSMVLAENQKQAADQVSVSNSINSLRFLAKMDWREFVEAMSIVEQTLCKDVDRTYARMDFYTRDHYRHVVEKIAKTSNASEYEVAQIAIDLAKEHSEKDRSDKRKGHVGYYLIGAGVHETEKRAHVRLTTAQALRKAVDDFSPTFYIATALMLTLILGSAMIAQARQDHPATGWLIAISVASLLVASQLALSLTNWLSTLLIKPKPLPKLDFSTGVPSEYKTLVVVPTLIANKPQLEKLIEDLEVRFLANRDPNLLFALLTDFRDAPARIMYEDEALLTMATKRITELNQRYANSNDGLFFLFHRPRRWNPVDKIWMGYERKRGKLSDLNHLLRGGSKDKFEIIIGDETIYSDVKYIITLDADTQLPRDAAWKLIGLMAHPLNHPRYDQRKRRVVEGYTIIQPRIAISLHGAERTWYTRLHENDSGIDPYTRVTSDVYQDVFCEGSYIGKGIYDLDAFEQALNNRFPENRILSHDLLEGSYARCGFASDVQFYEEYPSLYSMDIARRRRWIRGDWQIGNWFLPFVPNAQNRLTRNSISALSRWKIFDNLRRSLIPISFLLLLITGWTLTSSPVFWTVTVISVILLPGLIASTWSMSRKPKEVAITQHLNNTADTTYKSVLQAVFTTICLPYEAYISAHAIIRTLWRVYVSHRKLLEWNPSGFVQRRREELLPTAGMMWFAPMLSVATFVYLTVTGSPVLLMAAPFLLIWIASPAVVSFLGKRLPTSTTKLSVDQKNYLRELSRKTWSFFQNLVTEEDNWLPPDNLQQYPIPVIAHRTSPTNIGLSLLANLAAYDFGYATVSDLIDRTGKTFTTLHKLERYEGHFFNWYDTQDLRTLNPRYISTVDSGNLGGHLLTLRQGFLGLVNDKIIGSKVVAGMQDTLRVLSKTVPEYKNALNTLADECGGAPFVTLYDASNFLNWIRNNYQGLVTMLAETSTESHWWSQEVTRQINAIHEELLELAPWLALDTPPEKYKNWKLIHEIPTLFRLAGLDREIKTELSQFLASPDVSVDESTWLHRVDECVQRGSQRAREVINELFRLASEAFEFSEMEYKFLFDKTQRLLTIGYNVDDRHCDASFYDLLASEARLGVFVAIAQGKIPQESWFALGRRLTTVGNTPVLISWSGSMFEYLMPALVMPTYKNTLLDEMCIGTVKKQIEYGHQQNVPWGISESCYNVVDSGLTYQYRAFGVPGLGFKRGLGQDLVIAPYATVMAVMVDPQAAYKNLEVMRNKGFEGRYGFFEAVDYTPVRLSRGQSHAVIQTFMAHHQGMGLLSLAYLLLDQPMQKRFEADTQFQTALLLLQEQVPKTMGFYSGSADEENIMLVSSNTEMRVIRTASTPVPEIQLLSNGRYHVMLSNAGGGYSRWGATAVTRWREDTTCDNWGMFTYIRDLETGEFWSTSHQPTAREAKHYEAIFSQGKVEFRRRDEDIESYTEIIVSPEDDIEVRRIHLTNHSRGRRKLDITSYGEVVLASPAADDTHPAFNNLFVQTEINTSQHAICCTRRARSKEEQPPWMFHLMKVDGADVDHISYETDRSRFIGRGNTLSEPAAMRQNEPLSGAQGSVLDPIVSIQYKIDLKPGESAIVDIVTGIAPTREANQSLIYKYQDRHLRDRAFELSWTHSQVILRQINATESDAQLFAKLAGSVLFVNSVLRANPGLLLKNQRGQSALWSYSISGDLPIVLLLISDTSNITLVKQLIKAQAYWHLKGLAVDLVILNEDPSGYRQVLQDQIQGLIAAGIGISSSEKQGRIFVRPADQVPMEDRVLLQTVARVIISDTRGSLADQVNKRPVVKAPIPVLTPTKVYAPLHEKHALEADLQFFNGIGGFSPDGKEYVIDTADSRRTPLPWINVIANPSFGTIVSESGSSYTWFENAHEYRLTPWKNDPVTDACGEAFYIRDEESARFWSPMPLPVRDRSPYLTRHGFGYTIFEHKEDGIASEVCMYVDTEAAIKFVVVKIRNQSGRIRRLSATGYVEWVLGGLRPRAVMHTVTEIDPTCGALVARNPYNSEFQNYVSFFDVDDPNYLYTTDRTEFLGRNGSLEKPDAMTKSSLSGKVGSSLDPCAAIQVPFELENGKEREIVFKLGAGKDIHEVITTVKHFQGAQAAARALSKVKEFWQSTLGVIEVETPDASINLLANGWLLYQVLSCRLWGRSGYYQSGGAFGFRDQLQDVLALLYAQPQLTREQILLCASRQFKEGDVQHWWHPPLGRGVRTLCSDDFLWLPYVTSRYVAATGDLLVLEELVPFLQGRMLNVNEESYYDLPIVSDQHVSLYDHCKQSLIHAFRFGKNGLPLMGSGDWNDGMNMVGIHGRGESVWLAFFLYDVLNRFCKIAEIRGDASFMKMCEQHAEKLKRNINNNAWDGNWYLRAFFDDGTPLGSSKNKECMIDAIAQSWSVLSGAGEKEKALTAMQSVNKYLINREKGLIQLLEPPFDNADLDPGYIKGYVPGVRENGGQYTHAAIWMVMAFAKLRERDRTYELLNLINPIHHGDSPTQIAVYKSEPYVMAADVYGVAPHTGRGGWTWYTGSAGWMYQLIIESFLGLKQEGDKLTFKPCVPDSWKSFKVRYRTHGSVHTIEVVGHSEEDLKIFVDGVESKDKTVALTDSDVAHLV